MKNFTKNCLLLVMILLSTMVFLPQAKSQHFDFEGGNAADPVWTLYFQGITLDGVDLEAGDEIAVFDGETMVGAFILTQVCTEPNQFDNALAAFSTLQSGPGYTTGNPVTYKCWDASASFEGIDFTVEYKNPYGDAWTENTFPDGDGQYSIPVVSFTSGGPTTYEVITEANPIEGGTTTGDGIYEENTDATVIATANTGYEFVDWTVDGTQVSTDASYTFTVTADITLVANFNLLPVFYTVTTEANPVEGGTTTGDGPYEEGTDATVIATANTGYEFVDWTVDGTQVSTDASYTFTVMADITLVANFEEIIIPAPVLVSATPGIKEVSLVWEAIPEAKTGHFFFEGGNAADPVWTLYIGGATVGGVDLVAGDEIAVFDGDIMVGLIELTQVCTPDNQFENAVAAFSTLNSGPGYTPGNAYSFKAWSESAQEEYDEFDITLSDPYGGAWTGLVFPDGDGQYSMVEIDFAGGPAPILFNVYYEDGTLVAGDVEGLTYTDIGLIGGQEYCYYVTQILEGGGESTASNVLCATPLPQEYIVTTEANPIEGGTTTGDGIYEENTDATVIATANTGYEFIDWTVDGTQVSTEASYTFTVTSDITLVANFNLLPVFYTVTTEANPVEGGTTTGDGDYEEGTEATVIATVNSGYEFVDWTVDGTQVSTDASYTFTVMADITLVANFNLLPVFYTVTTEANPNEGGTTTGDGIYEENTDATVIATANTGYEFVDWTVDGTQVSTEASYTFTVTSDITLVANFEEIIIPAPVLVSATPGIEEVSLVWEEIPLTKTDHFMFEGGDPSSPLWTIYIGGATFDGMDMESGDEIGVYDGDLLVGA
ncbi:MAG: hypothetical protein JEY97_11560, partial [Bacteroidales bacterium]|nr:hypothetical protein [Bacteroidales bacterium]